MYNAIFAEADWLKAKNNQGYGTLPIPQPRDAEISDLLRAWMSSGASARQASGTSILEEQRFTLLGYSERMASLAVRECDQEFVVLGLVALGVDGWRSDWRDNAALVALHYDAAQRQGADASLVFERAAVLLSPNVANALRSFLQRSASDKTLEAMGYEASTDTDGFRYRRTW